jgi:asparagine synthase (glutamine-hydrolysing)
LIDSYRQELPESIWKRPKMGFSFPFAAWLSKSEFVKDMMLQGNENTRLNYEKFMKGNLHWSHLMSLIHITQRKYA